MTMRRAQGGYLLVVAAVIIMVAAVMAGVMVTMNVSSGRGGAAHAQSTQALYVAESGLEYAQRRLAQNVDWYRSATDPFDSAINAVGAGAYTVAVNLPATAVRTRLTTLAMTVNVFGGGAANRWPAAGILLIDDFGGAPEFVRYTSTTATSFTLSARDILVGTVQGSLGDHIRGDSVYPVTTLSVALVASCATVPNPFTIANNSKLLDAGTITVFHDNAGVIVAEQISYSGYTVAGGTRTLLGVQRCQNTLVPTPILASIGDPVAPLVSDTGTADFEVLINSTGNVDTTQRREYKIVQR